MFNSTWLYRAVAVVALGAVGACASPSDPYANRHQHLRDAKQGPAMASIQTAVPAPKLLHDHREMK
jgi:hypothetical protein